jgi:ketosteroid isomerase-like protein
MNAARQTLTTYYARLAENRFHDAVALFHDHEDVLWSIPGKGPMAGHYSSKPDIEKALETLADGRYGAVERPIHAICESDDGEHIAVQYLLRMRRADKICDIVAVDGWHVHDGELAEVWTFFETLYDFDAWTSSTT